MIRNILWRQIVVNLKHKFGFSEIKPIINRYYLQSFRGLVTIINIIIEDYPAYPLSSFNIIVLSLLGSDELAKVYMRLDVGYVKLDSVSLNQESFGF